MTDLFMDNLEGIKNYKNKNKSKRYNERTYTGF